MLFNILVRALAVREPSFGVRNYVVGELRLGFRKEGW
jgi:hypothetical protein